MSMQGTWCHGMVIQAVADQFNLRIVIAESHEYFRKYTIIQAVCSSQRPTEIYLGPLDEYHYVSTLPCSPISDITHEQESTEIRPKKRKNINRVDQNTIQQTMAFIPTCVNQHPVLASLILENVVQYAITLFVFLLFQHIVTGMIRP